MIYGDCSFEATTFKLNTHNLGWYHDGYPIMGHIPGVYMEAQDDSLYHLDLKKLETYGSWVLSHEIGHNVQWMTGFYHAAYEETTNEIWSIFVNQNVIFTIFTFYWNHAFYF